MYAKLTIVGYVGNTPELKYVQDGTAVCNFSLAVNKVWNDAQGQRREEVTWYRVACWRKQAEIVAQYVKKGKMVLVESDGVKAQVYTGNDGQSRASLEVTASAVRFLSPGSDTDSEPSPSDGPVPF